MRFHNMEATVFIEIKEEKGKVSLVKLDVTVSKKPCTPNVVNGSKKNDTVTLCCIMRIQLKVY